jgi:hypothetical protein
MRLAKLEMEIRRVTLETWISQSLAVAKIVAHGVLPKVLLTKSLQLAVASKELLDEPPCVVLPQEFYD